MGRVAKIVLIGLAVIAALVVVLIAVVIWQGSRTPSGRPEYVALGSSFAAGAGLGRLEPDSPLLCARSVNGYPQELARTRRLSLVDMSCGGAMTRHLAKGGQFFQGPQVRTITADTRLVTITAGGNDIGYVGDLSLLAARKTSTPLGWIARRIWAGPRAADDRDYASVRRDLLATLKAVRERAPDATIIVATYPTLLPPTGTCARIGLSASEVALMRRVGDRLAQVTRSAAQEGGARVVDMHSLGSAHSACSDTPWTTGYFEAGPAPFHPTRAGAIAVAGYIAREMDAASEGVTSR